MDRAFAYRPKSLTLVYLIEREPAALAYDWRIRFGLDLRDLRRIGWVTAWRLTSELLNDPFSHTSSALRGDHYVPSESEVSTYLLLDWLTSAMRGKNQVPKPLKRPWEGTPHSHQVERKELSLEQREKRRALMKYAMDQAVSDQRQGSSGESDCDLGRSL